jgi:hypothetical protein
VCNFTAEINVDINRSISLLSGQATRKVKGLGDNQMKVVSAITVPSSKKKSFESHSYSL